MAGVTDKAPDLLGVLACRHSLGAKYLCAPGVSKQELRDAVAVALRAPDHRSLRPFRFVHVGDHKRAELAGLFAADASRRGYTAAEVERARERACNGPTLLAVVAKLRENIEEVPLREQWMCVGAGVMNLLNALHVMGFGAKLLSGPSVRDRAIQAAFCRPGEMLVAWVLAGTPARVAHPMHQYDITDALSEWTGPVHAD